MSVCLYIFLLLVLNLFISMNHNDYNIMPCIGGQFLRAGLQFSTLLILITKISVKIAKKVPSYIINTNQFSNC